MQRIDTGIEAGRENIAGRPKSLGVEGRIEAAIIAIEQAIGMVEAGGYQYPATLKRRLSVSADSLRNTARNWAGKESI